MAVSTLDSLSTNGEVYLKGIANDFGGVQAAKIGQDAATRYLRQGERSGVVPAQLLGTIVALSMTAIALVGQFHKSPSGHATAIITPTEGVGCTITGSKEHGGVDGAWGVAKKVAPEGKLGQVYGILANQQSNFGGKVSSEDTLLLPPEACNNRLVEPISKLPQEPAE